MIRIKDEIDLKELEKFGFKDGVFTRIKNGVVLYQVVITNTHRLLQIRNAKFYNIAGSLQDLIYDLIQAGLVEKV